jgi:hypothetical protein
MSPMIRSVNDSADSNLLYSLYDHTILRPIPNCHATHVDQTDELRRALERSRLNVDIWGTNHRVLIWILFIGYSSTTNHHLKYWFSSYAQDVLSWTQLSLDRTGLKNILKSFLWYEEGHAQPFEELCSRIIKRSPFDCNCGHDHSF